MAKGVLSRVRHHAFKVIFVDHSRHSAFAVVFSAADNAASAVDQDISISAHDHGGKHNPEADHGPNRKFSAHMKQHSTG